MSRTYRRKKGYRFWTQDYYFVRPREFKNKKEMIGYFESDNFDSYGVSKKILKELSINSRRAKERQQIHKIMKSDNELHNYDDYFENSQLRKLIWRCL